MSTKLSLKMVYVTFGLLVLALISMVSYFIHVSNIQEEHRIAHNNKIIKDSNIPRYVKRIMREDRAYDIFTNNKGYAMVPRGKEILNAPMSTISQDMGMISADLTNGSQKTSGVADPFPKIQVQNQSYSSLLTNFVKLIHNDDIEPTGKNLYEYPRDYFYVPKYKKDYRDYEEQIYKREYKNER